MGGQSRASTAAHACCERRLTLFRATDAGDVCLDDDTRPVSPALPLARVVQSPSSVHSSGCGGAGNVRASQSQSTPWRELYRRGESLDPRLGRRGWVSYPHWSFRRSRGPRSRVDSGLLFNGNDTSTCGRVTLTSRRPRQTCSRERVPTPFALLLSRSTNPLKSKTWFV